MRVRKKPITVDAWLIDDILSTFVSDLPEEVRAGYDDGVLEFEGDRITIATIEGVMTGWGTWYLIRGIEGEFYPCEPDIFAKSYDILADTIRPTLLGVPTPYDANPEG